MDKTATSGEAVPEAAIELELEQLDEVSGGATPLNNQEESSKKNRLTDG